MQLKSYRFWVYWNDSPVKLTLTAANTESNNLCFHKVEQTDEGWSSEAHFYWLEVTFDRRGPYAEVHSLIHLDGKDCDGRLSQTSSWVCAVERLQDHDRGNEMRFPDWKEVSRKQRDYSAEAMNY